ncbi:MAG: IS200/IS605 family transposase [Bacteroidota bacterium]
MAQNNTYTQIHIHTVFAVKYREAVIDKSWKDNLYKYMTTVLQNYGHKMLQINGVADHVHLLFGLRPKQALSDLVAEVKESSSRWINQEKLVLGKFAWQDGFGAFSHSRSQVPQVIRYIQNQEAHHSKVSFREEYLEMLQKFEVDYDERYIFKDLE